MVGTDGGARPNPGIGGIGSVIQYKGLTKEISDAFELTTNNRMELMGIINSLKHLGNLSIPPDQKIIVYSDSQWAINALDGTWRIKENLDLVNMGKKLILK